MDQEKIGKFIRELRKSKNLTQQEFADTLGVTFQAVSKWENGKNIPDVGVMKIISEKYGVNVDEILEGEKGKGYSFTTIIHVLVVLIFLTAIIIFAVKHMPKKDDYSFKDVTSACEEYKIAGIAAYDANKSSLYISNIEYCGEKNVKEYDNITCTLYEVYDGVKKEISKCDVKENTTLDDFLKNTSIKVENYSSVCKDFKKIKLIIEINASSSKNGNYNHEVPLQITTCN